MRSPHSSGFSLLELILVLAIMVGLLAIAWPNVQRMVRRTSLQEAAQVVREAIDDCRFQAIAQGQPMFVRLQQGSSEIDSLVWGNDLQSPTLADESLAVSNDQLPPSDMRGLTSSQRRRWHMPTAIVISQVRWTLNSSTTATDVGDLDQDQTGPESLEPTLAENSDPARPQPPGVADNTTNLLPANAQTKWLLPITATGRSRDATIELFDTTIEQSLTVTFDSVTGGLEIER